MPNVFGIADDILVIGYNEDGTMMRQEVNLKLNKDKCHFRCMSIPFFGEVVSREGIQPGPQKIKVLTDMQHQKNKKKLQAFLGIINYLGKPLRKLTSSRMTWTWNALY